MARQVNVTAVRERIKANKVIMKDNAKIVKDEMAKAGKVVDFDARLARAAFSIFLKAAIAVSNDTVLLNNATSM